MSFISDSQLLISIPRPVREFWRKKKKYKYARDYYYVTNLEVGDENNILLKTYFAEGDVLIQRFECPEAIDTQPYINQFFDKNFNIRIVTKDRFLKGCYLRILVPFYGKRPQKEVSEQEKNIDEIVSQFINILRLKYGIGAALECVKRYTFDLKTDIITQSIEHIQYIVGNGREESSYYKRSVKSKILSAEKGFRLKLDASLLMDDALKTEHIYHRFMLLWMTLEAQLGFGKEREKFCTIELKSDLISVEMKRLHTLRSSYAHSIKKVSIDIEKDINMLLELIRLSILPVGKIRDELVRALEDELSS